LEEYSVKTTMKKSAISAALKEISGEGIEEYL
jgi:hypothetical protein